MRLLIVDDEAPARARLRRLLAAFTNVEVVGEAGDAGAALAAVATLVPDALLLDIQMPGASGLDLAASLPEPAPAVVFVSAHGHYALPAFDAAAVDYLLKPVEPERLARALERLAKRLTERLREREQRALRPVHPGAGDAAAWPAPAQLLVPDRGRTHVIACAEITWLEAADNYVVVHAADGRAPLMRRTLAALLADLGAGFVRTHRSAAVALAQVQAVLPGERGDAELLLRGGARVPCSRAQRAAVQAALAGRALL
ncbi:MAG: response regulator transcription factor [Rubrivivax sp.]|nr:response regulator transcription factor [Rubrivivax sp.]MCL4697717.1 LytTR family DNA-binding domain-containing protein [Burkholderiaceae bacterium]